MSKRWRTRLRAALPAFVTAFVCLSALDPASAQTRVCRDLETRLANLSSGGTPSRRARQYDKAIENQRAQIDKAEGQRRRAGCGGGFFSRGDLGRACQSLETTLERMHANLASLERKRRQMGGGASTTTERARLLAAIDANGCRERPAVARSRQAEGDRGRGLFEQLLDGPAEERRQERETRRFPLDDQDRRRIVVRRGNLIEVQPRMSGTFRTLCVRTCDGYFFPVAYSSRAEDLDRDAAACSAMCPGTKVELYMHRAPEEETDQMVSTSGVPYTALPTAFRYREVGYERPPGCGCSAERGFSILSGEPAASEPGPTAMPEPVIPMPVPRPDPAADPETLANREGGLDVEAIRRLLAPKNPDTGPTASVEKQNALPPPGERKVRVVGPSFLPDPEAAINLQAPAPNPIP